MEVFGAVMSLVVGFPCNDGVVIACDCASTARVNGCLARQKYYCDKFTLNSQTRWACAWAGSRASIIAATKMARLLDGPPGEHRLSPGELAEHLQLIGDQSFAERRQEDPNLFETASCLIAYDHGSSAFPSPTRLYELSISTTSTCTRIKTGTPKYLGDYVNPAAFFGWSLYGGMFPRRHATVDNCAFFAGFIVAAAHNFNPLTVDGLAVLVCGDRAFSVLDDALTGEIKRQSDEIGNDMWDDIRHKSESFAERLRRM